jgi:MFS family permease
MDAVDRQETERAEATVNYPRAPHDPYAALRHRDFRLLLFGRFAASFGEQMLSFAVGWDLWLRTHNELALGLVGLVQVIPVILLSLPAGHMADQYNRKRIIFATQVLMAICALGLAAVSATQGPLVLFYICLLGIGIARSFNGPATSTLLPQTVPPSIFTNAATWSSAAWQFAAVFGPTIAGVMVAVLHTGSARLSISDYMAYSFQITRLTSNVAPIYVIDAITGVIFLITVVMLKGRKLGLARKAATVDSLKEGLHFIWNTKELLAAITLDMFAVLFGGAVTLLPVYATDILHVGPEGLGIMRAAPSIGALIMTFIIASRPPFRQAGKTLLWAVAGFGVATIVFGVSKSFWLSAAMLFALGALDNISVVIRSTLVLARTPDEMRGRTSAVNSIFISTSNELGGFESGLMASLVGPVASVVLGGIGTIIVVLGIAQIWPEMRNLKGLDLIDEPEAVSQL